MLDVVMDWVVPALAVPGAASIAAALLPRPPEGSRLSVVFRVLDVLAANWLHARNAEQR